MATTPTMTHAYDVRISYYCDRDVFATETTRVETCPGGDVWVAAREAAENCIYFNQRIPNLSYEIEFLPPDPTEPPPGAGLGAVKPVCSSCGSDTLVRDACVRWDIETQKWDLSDSYECTICDLCGSESDDLAKWVPAGDITPLETFSANLAAKLNVAGLSERPEFQRFCFDNCLHQSVDEAAAAWWVSSEPNP